MLTRTFLILVASAMVAVMGAPPAKAQFVCAAANGAAVGAVLGAGSTTCGTDVGSGGSGNDQTLVGVGAGQGIGGVGIGGTGNTAVGRFAGANATNIVTGSFNTAIGSGAGQNVAGDFKLRRRRWGRLRNVRR